MKPVRCSWVDMQKVRASLSGGKRGNQKSLMNMRCVGKQTVSAWQAAVDVMDAIEKVPLTGLSTFQPTHATVLAGHMRRLHGKKPGSWPREDVLDWVELCEEKEFTVEQFESALLASKIAPMGARPGECCTVEDLSTLSAGEKFGCIYADPPWGYSNQATRASTDNHYPTMSVDEIAALPVGELAAERSHLHLWTTNAFLFECPRIFAAWGFEFKSAFIWNKPQMGIGNYWRNSHEYLLLAVRGGLTAADRGLKSWGVFDRTEHSAKPEKVRVDVEKLSPGPYLELFGRKPVPGWTVWGNQIRKESLFDGEVRRLA